MQPLGGESKGDSEERARYERRDGGQQARGGAGTPAETERPRARGDWNRSVRTELAHGAAEALGD